MLSAMGRLLVVMSLFLFVSLPSPPANADDAVKTAEADHDHDGHDHDGHDLANHDHDDGSVANAGHDSHADEAGTPPLLQFDFGSAICNLAIFLGVLAILSKFVWPVLLGGLKAREEKIFGELEQAAKANAEAKALLDDYQSKIDEASTKVQTMLADARKDSETAGQKIVDEAKAEADRQRVRAISDIETAKKVALSDLAGQTSDMAINVAKAIVGRELNSGDHAELIRQSLERLPSNN
ncbi:ATP synthase subunit b precursor [Rubripirellula tenax]|uniref:ATP synthase subunit b n=1 Tax=Rubripirellula tenax TaxID=2528015 RepID=A0A5C6EIB0_9BACT|nr:F0F1 ATP synthase subunit B [Rubripirellula tenax]TWU47386.1 ATP synthase subunit b precursor [Rubripirellula tenax]